MRASILKVSIIMLAVAVSASAGGIKPSLKGEAPAVPAAAEGEVTTTRDAQGVWFIEGGSMFEAFEAMGYAVAQDRLYQMDMFRRQARGTFSALLGSATLETDITLRLIGYSDEELTAAFEALSPDGQAAISGYVAGANRRIGEFYAGNWLQMPYEYWLLGLSSVLAGPGLPVLPEFFTVNDVVAFSAAFQRNFDGEALSFGQLDNGVLAQTLGGAYGLEGLAMFQDLRWFNDISAPTMIPFEIPGKTASEPQLSLEKVKALPDMSGAAERIRSRIQNYLSQMDAMNIRLKSGSYAWSVSGDKTASGNPILYSSPQMGFTTPSIIAEGSVRSGDLQVSGMHVPLMPGIAIGRTPHHAWSAQVGHAHTQDFFLESPLSVAFDRLETIEVFGEDDVVIPVFKSPHGPILDPFPYNPADPPQLIVSWAYANRGHETRIVELFLAMARAQSIPEVSAIMEQVGVSMHVTYADRDGDIAYWMTGWDPIRAPGANPLVPQIGDGNHEWTGERRPLAHATNPTQGYFGGWNNKASIDYVNAYGNYNYYMGPWHRSHAVTDYLSANDDLSFEDVRDLALNIATTDSFYNSVGHRGGNTWSAVADFFSAAVAANPSDNRNAAVDMIEAWDGHFVAGGPTAWPAGTQRADAWVLQSAWIEEVMRLTFGDEFAMAGVDYADQPNNVNFSVLIRALQGSNAALPTLYDWFQDKSGSGKPTDANGIIVMALDNILATIGLGPYGAPRGEIIFTHEVIPSSGLPLFGEVWRMPYSARGTYAQCVEFDMNGPIRIDSMFPLGESGEVLPDQYGQPMFNPNYFSMIPYFDYFVYRSFPLFD